MSASMSESALSIVIPVRNDARNLAICLAALRGADVPPFEMIVVDDASAEDVSSIVNKTTARYLRLYWRELHCRWATRASCGRHSSLRSD